ncbi:MAG: 5'/3'-nucleotidase SurE [Prolixibacteraceae bacterium]|nr:5'/3'-nucleotidase SurE [Prolixibacteraceae bacterium]
MTDKPYILITNDDGIHARGLKELVDVMKLFGDVVVLAPEYPQSGKSAAITVENPLRATRIRDGIDDIEMYKCNGTPVDCVKLAFNEVLERKPDLVVSGINHGANSSISVVYSGTVGAAIEGCLHGVPSLAFSLSDYSPDADFKYAKIYCAKVFQTVLENGLPEFVCLNVNVPKGRPQGIRVVRQAKGKWMEEFEKRTDPHSREYYWLSGYFKSFENGEDDSDIAVLENNMVSVVPVNIDMTCYQTLDLIKSWKF